MKKKKGFTLVELLVVITILAILAAVSVVGYLGFTEKANLSNDQTTIKMLNDNLIAEFVKEKPENPGEAMTKLENLGVTKEKMVAYSNGYHYAYDFDNNRFILLDDNDVVVYPEGANKHNKVYGLYMGNVSDNVGLDNYVIFEPLTDENKFKEFLGDRTTELNIDLNDKYIYLPNYIGPKLNVSNGRYVLNGNQTSINPEEEASLMEEIYKLTDTEKWSSIKTKTEYNNVIFDYENSARQIELKSGVTTTFNNCLFLLKQLSPDKKENITAAQFADENDPSGDKEIDGNTGVVFEKCLFVNTQWIQTKLYNVTVNECVFSNCSGGINLQNPTNANITNNIFDLSQSDTDASGNLRNNKTALMFAPMTDKDLKYHVNFTGNEINVTKSLILIHSGSYDKYSKIDPELLNFKNNKVNKITGNLVEEWCTKDGPVSAPEALKEHMKKMAEAIKNYNK